MWKKLLRIRKDTPARKGTTGPPHFPVAAIRPNPIKSATTYAQQANTSTVIFSLHSLDVLSLKKNLKKKSVSLKAGPTFSGRLVSYPMDASRPPTPVATLAVMKSSETLSVLAGLEVGSDNRVGDWSRG